MSILNKNLDDTEDFIEIQKSFKKQSKQNQSINLNQSNLSTVQTQTINYTHINLQNQKINLLEVSFANEFLHQHIESFDFNVIKYFQIVFEDEESQKVQLKNFLNQSLFYKKSISSQWPKQIPYYLTSKQFTLDAERIQIFKENLQNLQKFSQFLEFACSKCCDKVAIEVLTIAVRVCDHSLAIKRQESSYESLIKYSENIVEQNWPLIKKDENFQYINFKKTLIKPSLALEKILDQWKKFLEFMTTTMVLVIFQYFENPYYEQKVQDEAKRHRFFNFLNLSQCYDSFAEDEESSDEFIFYRVAKKRRLNEKILK